MLNKPQLLRRLLALCGLLLLCSGVALSQLFQLQLLNGEKYVRRSAEFLTTTSTVSAARGEILDRYGRPLVTNNTGFSLVLIFFGWLADKTSIEFIFRISTLLPLLGIITGFLPNIEGKTTNT